MKARVFGGLIILLAVIIINSCENKQGALPVAPCVEDTARVTYSSDSNTIQPIINAQCATGSSCHGSGASNGLDYSTYSGIFAEYQNGSLYAALFGGGQSVPQMPLAPQPGWDICTLNKFKAWINRGCPQ
jgi:hypothetical protein